VGAASYGYNAEDQPVSGTLPGSISQSMSYDPNSQLTSWGYLGPSTGVTTTTVNLAYNYAYDGANRTTALTITDNGVAQSEPITLDAAGRIIGWTGPNGPNSWAFDGDGDVISTSSFINGALRTTAFTYTIPPTPTIPQELLQQHTDGLGVDTYTYDGNGNVVSEVSTDPITSRYYVNQHLWYDAQERPVTVTNVINQSTVTATLGYNAAGQAQRITGY
jgi:YD repeat-containing protein